MIFAHTWEAVLAEAKTQTRRGARDGEVLGPRDDGRLSVRCADGRYRWIVGQVLAIQPGRGKHGVGRIEITAIRYCSRASDISEGDAKAEGFASAAQFREVYARINGARVLEKPCWALTFALVTVVTDTR